MKQTATFQHLRLLVSVVLCLVILALIFVITNVPSVNAQDFRWSSPVVISKGPGYSWFPDLAVDEFNSAHVIWCSTQPLPNYRLQEQVAYTHQTSTGWSTPNDIVPPSFDIVRNAIATDLNGHVLMLYGGSVHGANFKQYFTQANLNDAWSAQNWSQPLGINRGISYMGDIAVDSHGVIHVIYDDRVEYPGQENQTVYADIYYRKSTDGGKNWSAPVNLANSPETGSARPSLKIDSNDTLHVTWDEGWDRLTDNEAKSLYSVYTYSTDEGESWSVPKIINLPNGVPEQLTVGSTGKGGVMLVWRTKWDQRIYYQWSNDGGTTWSALSTFYGILARPWEIPFDMYDMASDSNGNIHLILAGQLHEIDTIPGVYHLVWNGKWWSQPEEIFWQDNLLPEYPKIVIYAGNQIHAAWFTREGSVWDQTVNRVIWYSRSKADAPAITIVPWPTPTAPLPTLTRTPGPSATPRPTIGSVGIGTTSPTIEKDYLKILGVALSPVVLLFGVVLIIKLWTRSHGR